SGCQMVHSNPPCLPSRPRSGRHHNFGGCNNHRVPLLESGPSRHASTPRVMHMPAAVIFPLLGACDKTASTAHRQLRDPAIHLEEKCAGIQKGPIGVQCVPAESTSTGFRNTRIQGIPNPRLTRAKVAKRTAHPAPQRWTSAPNPNVSCLSAAELDPQS